MMMPNFYTTNPDLDELAKMFQVFQDGILNPEGGDLYGTGPHWDIRALGVEFVRQAKKPGFDHTSVIAAGLRMVADAIDLPPMAQVNHDLAEMLARPKLPTSCPDCGRTGVPTYHCSAPSMAESNRDAVVAASARLHTGDPGPDGTDNLVERLPVWVSKMPGPCATCGSNTHLTISCRAPEVAA